MAQTSRSGDSSPPEQPLTARTIEVAWLVGLIAVPILFTPNRVFTFFNDPKYFVVHLVALAIIVAWIFEWAGSRQGGSAWLSRAPWRWAGRRPERWAVIAVSSLAIAAVISTLASPAPRVSLWGRDYLTLGYELYTFLALLTIFFAIALRLRTLQQASRIFMALMIAGGITALYAISQNSGWDPIGPGEDYARNFASFGNPIFFGSYLLLASLATIAVALEARRSGRNRMFIVSIIVLGIELAGLWTSESRGPFLGMAAGLLAFGVIASIWLNRRTLITGMGVIVIGIAIAVLITLLPEGDGGGATRTLEDLGDIFDSEQATSIGGRATTWEGALELAATWERSPQESTVLNAIRPVVGLGPEMYFYSYALSVERDDSLTGLFFAHVHNFPMQLLIEMGIFGLGSFLAVSLLVVYAAVIVLRAEKRAGRGGGPVAIFTAVALAALIGRAVEQMAGVAHVSDLITFWALAGLVVALAGMSIRSEVRSTEAGASQPRRAQPRPKLGGFSSNAPIVIAMVVLLLGIGLFIMRDVRGIVASRLAAIGFNQIKDGQSQEGLGKYERAAQLNPEVELYVMQVDFMIRGEAEIREDPAEKIALNELSLAVLEKYEDRDPFATATQRRIAKTELALGRLGQTERFESAVDRYAKLAAAMRSFPTIQALAADGIVAAGDGMRRAGDLTLAQTYIGLGLSYANRAIELDGTTVRGWWVKGVALERIGMFEDAVEAYLQSVRFGEGSIYAIEAHSGLARTYEKLGDPDNAEIHRLLAEPDAPEE